MLHCKKGRLLDRVKYVSKLRVQVALRVLDGLLRLRHRHAECSGIIGSCFTAEYERVHTWVSELSPCDERTVAIHELARIHRSFGATFYQPVSDDEQRMVVAALDVGTGVGSFGGHWYQCRNGHPYAIGECGGAMETSRCPECGEEVGGRDHHLSSSNDVARDFIRAVNGQQPPQDFRQQAARVFDIPPNLR